MMNTSVLVELADFVEDLLPTPPAKGQPKLDDKAVDEVKGALSKLLCSSADSKKAPGVIAENLVKVLNSVVMPHKYKAALSGYVTSNRAQLKVDAAIYPEDRVPADDLPDWACCRFYLAFVRDSRYDLWDDRAGTTFSESQARSRADVRAQLVAYARQVFLYQHRTTLFSLFFVGDSFRAVRWDRSGVIVSQKVNYAKNPEPLLSLVTRLVLLDETRQGLDSTATLIKPDTMAFRMMDELAQPDEKLDMDYMEHGTEDYNPPPAHPPHGKSLQTPSVQPGSTSSGPHAQEDTASQPAKTAKERRATQTDAPGSEQAPQPGHGDASHEPAPEDQDSDLEEVEEVDGDPRVFRYVREKFRASLAAGWPRYKLTVGRDERVFLVAKPMYHSSSMFGRATRGYVAVDARTRRFVFLKDSWRPIYEGALPEGVHLERFEGDDDIIVPAILCHGDVGDQYAYTAQYQELVKQRIRDEERRKANGTASTSLVQHDHGNKRPHTLDEEIGDNPESPLSSKEPDRQALKGTLRQHVHYRVAVKDVCLPFEEFRLTFQLLSLMLDCVQTHYYAYTKHGLLHGDISAGNVLILPRLVRVKSTGKITVRWRGVLTDWELAKPCSEDRSMEKARQPECIGTWQFMAVAHVDSQWTLPVAVADELESFFHVTLFYAVRFLRHTILNVPGFVEDYFDAFQTDHEGRRLCSQLKGFTVTNGRVGLYTLWKELSFVGNNPMNTLVASVLDGFRCRYAVLRHERDQAELSKLSAARADSGTRGSGAPLRRERDDSEWRRRAPKDLNPVANFRKSAPTAEVEATARSLDHPWMLNLIADVIDMPDEVFSRLDTWVVQDQLVDHDPRAAAMKKAVPPRGKGSRGTVDRPVKRARTDESTSAASTSSSQLSQSGASVASSGSHPHPSG